MATEVTDLFCIQYSSEPVMGKSTAFFSAFRSWPLGRSPNLQDRCQYVTVSPAHPVQVDPPRVSAPAWSHAAALGWHRRPTERNTGRLSRRPVTTLSAAVHRSENVPCTTFP